MEALHSPRWNLFILLALASVFAQGVIGEYKPYLFLHGDGAFYATTNRALLDGHLDQHAHQPASWYEVNLGWNQELDAGWSNVALGARGEFYPKHPLPLPILATPLFWLFSFDGLLLFNVLASVLTLWLAWRIAARYTDPRLAAFFAIFAATVPLFARGAYAYSNDVLYGALIVGAIERYLAAGYGWSGLFFGIALWCKPTNIVIALPFGAMLLVRRQWRAAFWMAGMALVPLVLWFALNTYMFGGPFTTSYNRILVRTGGQSVVLDLTEKFTRPIGIGIQSILFDEFQGLLPMASLLLVGLLGLIPLAPRAPLLVATLVVSIPAFLWLHARYDYTYARFFTPWAALLIVPLTSLCQSLLTFLLNAWRLKVLWMRHVGWLRTALVIAGLLAVVVGLRTWTHRDPHRWSAAYHIEQAKVVRDPGRNAMPCDYFNPRYLRWECAQIEPDTWQHWGRAFGDHLCRFPQESKGWLWLHPNPGHEKSLTFAKLPQGPIMVRYGLGQDSHFAGVKFQLRGDGGKVLRDVEVQDIGTVHELTLAPAERGQALGIAVPAQAFDWRHLCVDVSID